MSASRRQLIMHSFAPPNTAVSLVVGAVESLEDNDHYRCSQDSFMPF